MLKVSERKSIINTIVFLEKNDKFDGYESTDDRFEKYTDDELIQYKKVKINPMVKGYNMHLFTSVNSLLGCKTFDEFEAVYSDIIYVSDTLEDNVLASLEENNVNL
ncbi:TPA_asm: hypothetical protein GZX72_14565, partial [Listeria monocytogenes]|nr:hypothetical protein [Listeria monocytogenes]